MRRTKKSLLLTFLFAIAVFSLASCVQKGKGGKEDNKKEETPLVTDSLHISKSTDDIISVDYDFHFLKPGSVVADSINAKINEQCISGRHDADIRTDITTALAKEIDALKAEVTEFHDPDDETFGEITYHVGRKGRFVADAADTVIVYHYAIDMYTGGAHGSYVPFTLNFSKRTGLAISISDVLDTAHEQAILDIMLARLLKDNDCSTREELIEKTGILGLGDLYLTENFHLGKDSITFCFGQYDIAPYSSGITYISLSYDSLKQYLKTN